MTVPVRIVRHRDRADGKGNSKDQGGGRKDEEGPNRKSPGRTKRIAHLKIKEDSGKGGASFFSASALGQMLTSTATSPLNSATFTGFALKRGESALIL